MTTFLLSFGVFWFHLFHHCWQKHHFLWRIALKHFLWWKKQISLNFVEEVKVWRKTVWFFKEVREKKPSFNMNKNFMTNSQDPPRIVAPKTLKNIWLSNLSALRVPDGGYSRNVLWSLNLIPTFLAHVRYCHHLTSVRP